jgi:hypothetical protein
MMLEPDATLNVERNAPQIAKRSETLEALVCLALVVAIFALAFRIARIW